MKIPQWVQKQVADEANAVPSEVPMATSAAQYHGWKILGRATWTLVEHVDYPRDPALMAAIREFDPDAIFALRRMTYLPPGSDRHVVVYHHAVLRYVANPINRHRPFYVETPLGYTGPIPNVVDYIHEDLQDPMAVRQGGPPPYRPFDRAMVAHLRDDYRVVDIDRWEEDADAVAKETEDYVRSYVKEQAWIKGQVEKTIRAQLDRMTPDDWLRYAAKLRSHQARPFVQMRGAAV